MPSIKHDVLPITALLLLFAGILLSNLGREELSGSDEPRYAQIAREMMETGQYILPHKNAEVYPDKPPVLFWLISLASLSAGEVTAFSARLPSALAGLVLIALTFLFARKLYDPLTGIFAAVILFTTRGFFSVATSVHFDVIFACWTTLALFFFYRGYTAERGALKWYLLSYCSMGGGLLTKGPVGIIVPAITVALFLWAKKDLRRLRDMHVGTGLMLAAGMLALWLIPACIQGGWPYTENIIFKQSLGRTVESFSHKAPFYYYLYDFPLKSLPWSIFVPGACIYFWRTRKKSSGILLPLLWFAGTFAFFSAVSCKRSLYLLHLYPAFALLLAKFWRDALVSDEVRRGLVAFPMALLFGSMLLAGAAAVVALACGLGIPQIAAPVKNVFYPAAVLAICAGCAGLVLLRRGKPLPYAAGLLAIVLLVAYYITAASINPALSSRKTGIAFCEKMKRLIGPDDLLMASFEPDYFNYMLHRYPIPVVDNAARLTEFLTSSKKVFFLAKKSEYARLPAELKQLGYPIDEAAIGRMRIVLFGNEKAALALR